MNRAPAGIPLQVVLDTNIYIAAFHWPRGTHFPIWRAARDEQFTLLISPALVEEVVRVLRTDFQWQDERIQPLLRLLAHVAVIIQPATRVRAVKADPDDDRVLECAVAGNADILVSNDKHLSELKVFRGIPIVTGKQFRRILAL
jgi:putative PIN family toxin of toxin-antitoxin system